MTTSTKRFIVAHIKMRATIHFIWTEECPFWNSLLTGNSLRCSQVFRISCSRCRFFSFLCLLLSFRCCMFINFRCHQSVSAPSTANKMNIRKIMTKYLIAKPRSLYQPIATSKLKVNSYIQWWCRWFALVPLNVDFFRIDFYGKGEREEEKTLHHSRMSDFHFKRSKYRLVFFALRKSEIFLHQ